MENIELNNYEEQEKEFKEIQERSNQVIQGAIKVNLQIENSQENYRKYSQISDQKFQSHNVEELKSKKERELQENNIMLTTYKQKVLQKELEVTEKNRLMKQIQQS